MQRNELWLFTAVMLCLDKINSVKPNYPAEEDLSTQTSVPGVREMDCLRSIVARLLPAVEVYYSAPLYNQDTVLKLVDSLHAEWSERRDLPQECHILHIISLMTVSLKDDSVASALCVLLFCKLILIALQSSVSTTLISRGYNRVVQRIQKIMTSFENALVLGFQWENRCDIKMLIAAKLSTYNIVDIHSAGTIQYLSNMLLPAAKSEELIECGLISDKDSCISYNLVVGPDVSSSKVLDSALLMDIPITRDFELAVAHTAHKRGFVVALFECSMELPVGSTNQTVILERTAALHQPSTPHSVENELLEAFARQLQRSHVTFVGCQKRVHPYLLRRLQALNILCVPRVSVRFMAALQRLSGARQLGSIAPFLALQNKNSSTSCLDPGCLGYLYSVGNKSIYGKPFVVAQGWPGNGGGGAKEVAGGGGFIGANTAFATAESFQDHLLQTLGHLPSEFLLPYLRAVLARRSTCTTVLVTAPTEALVAKWHSALENTISYVRALIQRRDAVVLPGGGIWLAALAKELAVLPPEGGVGANISHQQRQVKEAEAAFQRAIKECAVRAGGACGGAYTEEGEKCAEDLSGFHFPARMEGNSSTDFTTFHNARGDDAVQIPVRKKIFTEETPCRYVIDSRRDRSCVKLDSFDSNLRALVIAVDMACTLLDVDGFVSAENENCV